MPVGDVHRVMESSSASVPCPECGAPTAEGELCDECYADGVEPLDVPDEVEVRVCAKCGSYVRDGGWRSHDEPLPDEELAVNAVKDALRMHVEAREPRVSVGVESRDTNTLEVDVEAVAYVRGYRVEEDRTVGVHLDYETCPTCAKRSGGYYESVAQIRARGTRPDRGREGARSGARLRNRRARLRRPRHVRHKDAGGTRGLDIYMSTSDAGLQIARRMTQEYGGGYDDSATLVGEKEGEELYRVTYAVALPEFVPGDVVEVEGTPLLVTQNEGVLKGVDLRTGDRRSFSDASPERLGRADDAEATTVVSVSEDCGEMQVLDPANYETVTIRRPSFVVASQGEEVNVVSTSEGVYPIPDSAPNKNS